MSGDEMTQYVYGLLHGVDEQKRVIAIKHQRTVRFYYMAKGLFNSFMLYFKEGIFVYLYVSETPRRYRGYMVQNVESIEKIISPHRQNPTIYYDINVIKSGIQAIVNARKPKLFLDFEMSMPPYRNFSTFISEIIQVGYVLTDESGNILEEVDSFVKPTFFPEISERTKRFLHLEQSDIETGISFRQLYDQFTDIIQKYKPMIFVWGQNDLLELRKLNQLHRFADFTSKTQFIDLLKLHKTYFGLKNDLGLFNAYNLYFEEPLEDQGHDAFEDASITMKIYEKFVDVCNHRLTVELPNSIEE